MTFIGLSLETNTTVNSCAGSTVETNVMDAWLKKYGKDFVAHAIWPMNVPYVMKCGKVKPKELMYREAETSFNYGDFRNRITIQPPDLKYFAAILKDLPYENAGLNIRGSEVFQNGKAFRAIYELFEKTFSGTNLREYQIQVLRDELAGRPLDRILAEHYKNLKAKGYSEAACTDMLFSARSLSIDQCSLNYEVRAGKNCIYWNFGDVVVLRGNGSSITNYLHSHEAFLLDPAHNNGEFFCLDLARDDTLILGPKSILEPYKEKCPKYNFVFLEDLTPEQIQTLEVPESLLQGKFHKDTPDFKEKNTQTT